MTILANDIIHFIESSADLEAHKSEITSSTRLRKGTATQAQQRINAEPTQIEHLLRRKRKERTPLQRGKDFVKKNFVDIVKEPRTNIKGKDEITKRAPKAKNDNVSVKNNKEKPESQDLISTSLNPFLRSVLLEEIQKYEIKDAASSATDSLYEYILIMLRCVAVFNSAKFLVANSSSIDLHQSMTY
ncbi:hypothetical protein INT47_001909 [Mucor saturninus]|uniref:Uncharacterized protein n=1 Tax=Mucor saturninus TaxID=64648 RepID=A0A8H7RHJ3_9FUNG|nr:hypothetical protein INT47_001909 [Mucor saturninus]